MPQASKPILSADHAISPLTKTFDSCLFLDLVRILEVLRLQNNATAGHKLQAMPQTLDPKPCSPTPDPLPMQEPSREAAQEPYTLKS